MANLEDQKRVIQIIKASPDPMTILKIIDQLNPISKIRFS